MKNESINKIIINYTTNNIREDIREEFLNSAIHFIVNEELCSKEDIMKIRYRFKKIKSNNVIDYIKIGITYGYVFYRIVIFNLVDEELFNGIKLVISNLNITNECNKKVLQKFEKCSILY